MTGTSEPSFGQETAHSSAKPVVARPDHSALLEEAVVQTVVYSDVFDYPLTAAEIHRYLIDIPASPDEIQRVLGQGQRVRRHLSHREGYFTLQEREATVETRRRREQQANQLWRRAITYGGLIASLPFVRMVAVTGELAMDNTRPTSDIDYFIVTEPGRLWLARLMVIAIVRYAAPRGDVICPNYLLAENALKFEDQSLYAAHEVAQMVPIFGFATYRRLRETNSWVQDVLPNTGGPPRYVRVRTRARPIRLLVEAVLRTRAGGYLEDWEMQRKIRKLAAGGDEHAEIAYSADRCKGHVDGHGERILSLFHERWNAVKVLTE